MDKHRKLEHPEILVDRAGAGIFDEAFTLMSERYGEELHTSSGHAAGVAEQMGLRNFIESDCNKAQFFALLSWWKNDKPIYRLTTDLTLALAHTTPPMKTFNMDPKACVPLSGMYIALPPVFFIGSSADNSEYAIEGIYIVEDLVRPKRDAVPEDGILFLGVGEDKAKGAWLNRTYSEGPCRDDTLIFFTVCQDKSIEPLVNDGAYIEGKEVLGATELSKLALNLLWMLQNVPHAISHKRVPNGKLKGKKDRTRRREAERLNLKGRTHKGYIVLDLATDLQKPKQASVKTKTVRAHIVRGHVHHYWVNDPKGKKSVETKIENGKTRYLVPKWVLPYRKGTR
jgi:hypothetical protein